MDTGELRRNTLRFEEEARVANIAAAKAIARNSRTRDRRGVDYYCTDFFVESQNTKP